MALSKASLNEILQMTAKLQKLSQEANRMRGALERAKGHISPRSKYYNVTESTLQKLHRIETDGNTGYSALTNKISSMKLAKENMVQLENSMLHQITVRLQQLETSQPVDKAAIMNSTQIIYNFSIRLGKLKIAVLNEGRAFKTTLKHVEREYAAISRQVKVLDARVEAVIKKAEKEQKKTEKKSGGGSKETARMRAEHNRRYDIKTAGKQATR